MSISLNRFSGIGHVGAEPEIRTMQNGDSVCNLRVATSVRWKDKASGEWKERTQWHRVVIFNQGLIKRVQNQVTTGTPIYFEGALEYREYEKDGQRRSVAEIVLRPFAGELRALNRRETSAGAPEPSAEDEAPTPSAADYFGPAASGDELADEIPF